MFKKLAIGAAFALALTPAASFAAGGGDQHIEDFAFSFEGPFGTWDQNQLQRGLQIYTEVCAACHGLQYVPLRDLEALGYNEEQVITYAADNFEVFDPELDDFRPAIPTDHFPANTAVGAPDLSLMAKARAGFHGPYGLGINQLVKGMGGAEYIASLLDGYTGKEKEEAGTILYENTAFPGGWISMAPPLAEDQVEFADGHPASVEAMSEDVSAFLMWAAEPKMMDRKNAGFVGVIFLSVLSVLLYLVNKRLWAPHKGKLRPED
ncbi:MULTISPECIES: cytochrome c1 [unclassified Ruegeria]|uniref:cytochrome c1 n=1 Tax=unclassified Ruegeria TaxID=2625375 RepID=UPI001489EFF1|nr:MULTISPECIES: cytochrome c1 [unclassified Ruegeria]NOD63972.1 cytochrome c1 [Ruegeria sp. HKCCD6109]NOD76190.1 cytochrome c1 [Ruegeria sp. HKCCD4332]NOD90160.1 cytochrome c1 [Ruegeria sp. HKCCD4318]NOD94065.1 cytochrome c1 [Ruegeria sp. HKCCD4884]NOE15233.1 cytochrome c1 [Ruegeria sp. HKCCD4318-2]